MKFYEEISDYYEGVFPMNNNKIEFIVGGLDKSELDMKNERLLDVACGIGTDVLELNKRGYQVEGLDLEENMINRAKEFSASQDIHANFRVGSMLELEKQYKEESLGAVLCTGNSLVHLEREDQIKTYLKEVYKTLVKGGLCLVQIINFDRVLDQEVKSLPTITNEEANIEFVRLYENVGDRILFKTHLKARGKEYTNEILLYPLRKKIIETMLTEIGYVNAQFFGNFKGDAYDENSYATIFIAEKPS